MTSKERARAESALLNARFNLSRALKECEAVIELEALEQDVWTAWTLIDGVCERFVASDRKFLLTRPHERTIEQRHGEMRDGYLAVGERTPSWRDGLV